MHTATFWGKLIRQLRAEHGVSEREISKRSHVARTTVRKIEAGTGRPTVPQIEALLGVFGYELDAFPRHKEEDVA